MDVVMLLYLSYSLHISNPFHHQPPIFHFSIPRLCGRATHSPYSQFIHYLFIYFIHFLLRQRWTLVLWNYVSQVNINLYKLLFIGQPVHPGVMNSEKWDSLSSLHVHLKNCLESKCPKQSAQVFGWWSGSNQSKHATDMFTQF